MTHGSSEALEQKRWTDREVDLAISVILRSGVLISSIIAALGGVVYLLHHASDTPQVHTFHAINELRTLSGILSLVATGNGDAIMQLGVVLLLLTPIVRVAFGVFAFLMERDYTYMTIAAIVLSVLLFSLIGKH